MKDRTGDTEANLSTMITSPSKRRRPVSPETERLDEIIPATPSPARSFGSRKLPAALNGFLDNGVWKCNCMPRQLAVLRTVKKETQNFGRKFYTCPSTSSQCGFFIWENEAKLREGEDKDSPFRSGPQAGSKSLPKAFSTQECSLRSISGRDNHNGCRGAESPLRNRVQCAAQSNDTYSDENLSLPGYNGESIRDHVDTTRGYISIYPKPPRYSIPSSSVATTQRILGDIIPASDQTSSQDTEKDMDTNLKADECERHYDSEHRAQTLATPPQSAAKSDSGATYAIPASSSPSLLMPSSISTLASSISAISTVYNERHSRAESCDTAGSEKSMYTERSASDIDRWLRKDAHNFGSIHSTAIKTNTASASLAKIDLSRLVFDTKEHISELLENIERKALQQERVAYGVALGRDSARSSLADKEAIVQSRNRRISELGSEIQLLKEENLSFRHMIRSLRQENQALRSRLSTLEF
ncbi:uncharacterized protein V1510DRAFT_55917 [Dipodascopsis tothii]|uniref:uncharacterized protein n=1 Tax=Dipodascopsis tothii TaxID=44089 RepID=UPI0034CE6558